MMYVLVLTSQTDATADYLCSRMRDAGMAHVRLDTESLTAKSTVRATPERITFAIDGIVLDPTQISAVWFRRPAALQHTGGGDQHDRAFAASEWTAALEGFLTQIPVGCWVNHPSKIMGASSKLEQLVRAARHGLTVPPWVCTDSADDAARFRAQHGSLIAKPLYCGYIERGSSSEDTVIYTTRVPDDALHGIVDLGAPTLFQQQVVGGVDVRVNIVDKRVRATALVRTDGAVDVRRDNMASVRYSEIGLPTEVEARLLLLTRSYGLRFAAIDMIAAGDRWHFLEVNPNGQWAWLDLVGDCAVYKMFLAGFTAGEDHLARYDLPTASGA